MGGTLVRRPDTDLTLSCGRDTRVTKCLLAAGGRVVIVSPGSFWGNVRKRFLFLFNWLIILPQALSFFQQLPALIDGKLAGLYQSWSFSETFGSGFLQAPPSVI